MLKDADLIEQFAESLQSRHSGAARCRKNLELAVALGVGKENASAVIEALEREAGVEVKAH
jgi:3-hydroxyisobutyrate dehydrogenase-like beta-hydroxyacid dehydrogenase